MRLAAAAAKMQQRGGAGGGTRHLQLVGGRVVLGGRAGSGQRGLGASTSSAHVGGKSWVRSMSTSAPSAQVGGKSWVPQEDAQLQKIATQSLIHEVSMTQIRETENFVPWFLKNMPASYFRQVPEPLKKRHIAAIGALRTIAQSDLVMKLDTKGADGAVEESTFICKDPRVGLLNSQISSLSTPEGSLLSRVQVYTTQDNSWALNIFSFASAKKSAEHNRATRQDAGKIFDYLAKAKSGTADAAPEGTTPFAYNKKLHSEAAMLDYISHCSVSYVSSSNPRRFLGQREMYERVRGTDGTVVSIEPAAEEGMASGGAWITIACANVLPQLALRLGSALLKTRGLDIQRAHLDTVADPSNSTPELPGHVCMLRMLVAPHPLVSSKSIQGKAPTESPQLEALLRDLKRSKWIDDKVVSFGLTQHPQIGQDKAEVICAIAGFLHGSLHKINPAAYGSVQAILDMLSSSPHFIQLADQIASLFLQRFNPAASPRLTEADFAEKSEEIRKKIARLQFEQVRVLLQRMLDSVRHTQKTNFYHPDRYALGFRFNPEVMRGNGGIGESDKKPLPFGIIYVHGRDFMAYHNRFRDIARGGLRVVTPPTPAQHAAESSRAYDEAYGLSYAQQLKNKDIPEGGSKAVVLVDSSSSSAPGDRFTTVRTSIRAFTDSLLDLTVKESCSKLVDLYKKEELIYLGPDEQVIPSDIDWITLRAAQRGYPIPAAFMSSKAGAGFNHKQYGVTSEGVVCYLETALNAALGLDPRKQPFTVKITGGPDGDVAGNLIKILFREFPKTCKVLGVSDGTGVCEDPKGLDAAELLRLVDLSQPIVKFNPSKLGPDGVCLSIESDEGLSRRNSMVFRIKSDAFVPAGGRPNTINGENWKQFLDPETGKPTSPLVVEGANIFFTPEARENLFGQAGVAIVKDSSANKCGVITSSCEVAASMLLSTPEFLANKDALVGDVLVKLRHLARLEAELLFREYKNYPGALPHFSERISNAINTATDVLTERLSTVNPGDALWTELLPLVKENLPAKLASLAWDRVLDGKLPVQYTRNAIASTLASKVVYAEGIHLIETQPLDRLADRLIQYQREDVKLNALVEDVDKAGIDGGLGADKAQLVKTLLRRGGTRSLLNVF